MANRLKREYIRQTLKEITDPITKTQKPYQFVNAPSTGPYKDLPDLVFFDPICQLKVTLICENQDARHENSKVRPTNHWTDYGKQPARLIYGLEKNAYLVCKIYHCDICHSNVRSTDPFFLEQLPDSPVIEFTLYHDSAVSSTLYNLLVNQVARGTTFADVEKTFCELKKTYFAQHLTVEERQQNKHMNPDTYKCISASHIADIFMHWFRLHQSYLIDEFKEIKCEKLSIDHTFFVSSLVKILDESGSKRQFVALLIVLNEDGMVVRFSLCKSQSLRDLENIFKDIANKHSIEEIFSDNCCHDRQILEEFFGDQVRVYLDLFHAIQRVTRYFYYVMEYQRKR